MKLGTGFKYFEQAVGYFVTEADIFFPFFFHDSDVIYDTGNFQVHLDAELLTVSHDIFEFVDVYAVPFVGDDLESQQSSRLLI